jgi:signal transduction histidine kinase
MQAQIRRRERELSQSLRRQSEMHDYVALVTQAQEDERKRIARELHDDTVQALVAIVRQLEILSGEAADTRRARERMQEMMALADNTLASLRRFTRDLRPPVLDDLGLEAALWWLTASFRERTTMTIDLESRGPAGRLLPATEVALYRIAQEALNNAEKHSSARRVTVILEYLPDEVRLSIQDDGAGFAVPGKKGKSALGNAVAGLGILGMQERAQLLGGSLDISSTAGEGTIVTARIPSSRPQ